MQILIVPFIFEGKNDFVLQVCYSAFRYTAPAYLYSKCRLFVVYSDIYLTDYQLLSMNSRYKTSTKVLITFTLSK